MSDFDRDSDKTATAGNEGAVSKPRPETARGGFANPELAAMQSEVMLAVRGAITGAMANRVKGVDLPDLDFDFSTQAPSRPIPLPLLRAELERALALPSTKPRGRMSMSVVILTAAAIGAAAAAGVATTAWSLYARSSATQTAGPSVAQPRPVEAASAPAAVIVPAKNAITVTLVPAQTTPAAAIVRTAAVAPVDPVVLKAPQPAPLRESVESLLEHGHIVEARQLLIGEKTVEKSGGALTMARSFDPNYLSTLGHANAGPDIAEARRWYRRWYDLAIKEGAVPESIRVDLLLQSLDRTAAAQ